PSLTPHASRSSITHASRLTIHDPSLTTHASRLTIHHSRFTPHASRFSMPSSFFQQILQFHQFKFRTRFKAVSKYRSMPIAEKNNNSILSTRTRVQNIIENAQVAAKPPHRETIGAAIVPGIKSTDRVSPMHSSLRDR